MPCAWLLHKFTADKTLKQLQMIIGIYCIKYWYILIREGRNSREKSYKILSEKQTLSIVDSPKLQMQHHFAKEPVKRLTVTQ